MSALVSGGHYQEINDPLRPVRCDNCGKTAKDVGKAKLSICSACASAPYCSVECQRQNWKTHKVHCKQVTSGDLTRQALSSVAGDIGDGQRQGNRTMGQVLQDLGAWAQIHNGESITVAAWHALGLVNDLNARKSKILLLGLCRTSSTEPKTFYTLKDACALPMTEVRHIFKNRSGGCGSPSRMLKDAEAEHQGNGHIGGMLVVSFEQSPTDERPIAEAVAKMSTMVFQPLGVFEVHRDAFRRIGQLSEEAWKACLGNALRGGQFYPVFRPA
ncbi:ankyrin [Favolaschia claudopus]|uniref:Ankyrin n=1 Tax=Favolaschia claudopus TaxID=2862362 RepID=A0AAW0C9A2_9AGAR